MMHWRAHQRVCSFFHPVSPSESSKVMGLKGIHHPDALHCFTGLTFCPWCGREGQNVGTMINHLWDNALQVGASLWQMSPASLWSLQRSYVIMAKAASCPGKVMVKRKMGGPMMYPYQTNQPQPSPLARTLSAVVGAMQALPRHSLFRMLKLFQ